MNVPPARSPRPRQRRPGYIQCERILKRLHRFQDLVRHDQRWGYEIGFARPLEELLPKGTRPVDQATEIDRQINRLIPLVVHDLRRVGIPAEVEWRRKRYDAAKRDTVDEPGDRHHLIADYFHLPRDGYASAFKEVMGAIDR